MYKIVRHYFDRNIPKRTIKARLTLDEAQAHCRDPETSSSTCKLPQNTRRTRKFGPWFDGFVET
jgi:hypothetical protein